MQPKERFENSAEHREKWGSDKPLQLEIKIALQHFIGKLHQPITIGLQLIIIIETYGDGK